MNDFQLNFGGDEINDGDGEETEWQFGGKNATIFLIDCAPQMFVKDADDSPFVTSLKVCFFCQ